MHLNITAVALGVTINNQSINNMNTLGIIFTIIGLFLIALVELFFIALDNGQYLLAIIIFGIALSTILTFIFYIKTND